MFPRATECLPCELPISPSFSMSNKFVSPFGVLFHPSGPETQQQEQCVNGSIYHLVWLAPSLWGWVPKAKGRSPC